MSYNEQEASLFKFNKTNFNKLIKEIRTIYNNRISYDYEFATALYFFVKENKIKNKDDLKKHFYNNEDMYVSFKNMPYTRIHKVGVYSLRLNFIINELYSAKDNKLRKPRKTIFKKLTSKDKRFNIEGSYESGFTIDYEKLSVIYQTDYNNHSAYDSLKDPFVSYFLNFLKNQKWGRNEGGWRIYHSENKYFEFFDIEYPEHDIITDFYGSLGEKMRKDIKATLRLKSRIL